jgi:hypothetical protein
MSKRNPWVRVLASGPACARAVGTALVLLVACGASSEATLDEASFIRVGVEPRAVIDDATRGLRAHGLGLEHRVDTAQFSAASFVDRASGRSAIRVATPVGTALALDARADEGSLVSLDPRTGEDWTADGQPDLVIVRTEPERTCLALAEVDDAGALRPVPTERRWLDASLCIDELVDLDRDRRLDAIVRMPLSGVGQPRPTVSVPLLLDDRHVFSHTRWPEGFAQAEIARRDAALEVALDRGALGLVVQLSIELAMIVGLRGGDDADIDARLDRARALPLSAADAEHLETARSLARAAGARQRDAQDEAARRRESSPPPPGSPTPEVPRHLDGATVAQPTSPTQ